MEWTQQDFTDAIESARIASVPVYLPEIVRLSDTIDLSKLSGLRICGLGGVSLGNFDSFWRGTRIIWRGSQSQPVFRTAGIGNVFSDFAIDFEWPAYCGIHVVKSDKRAAGKHVVERCSFIGYDRKPCGIVCGESENEGHCDAMRVRDCFGERLRSLFHVRNDNSVGHVISGCQTNYCESAYDFLQGGKASIFGHSSIGDRCVLTLGSQGKNNCAFELHGLSVDAQAGQDFVLVRSRLRPFLQNVTISGHLSGAAQKPLAELIDMLGGASGLDVSRLSGVKAA